MKPSALPANEWRRLKGVCELDLLDTPAEDRFDRITRIASRYFKTPIAVVGLLDAERLWFESAQGLEASEMSREISFCAHAILGDDILYITDTLDEPRFCDNPLVTGPPGIRFYAGAPLSSADGTRVGTLCIMDNRPRRFSKDELSVLRDLASCVESELERTHRLKFDLAELKQAQATLARFTAIIDSSDDAIIGKTMDGIVSSWNVAAEKMFGYTAEEAINQPITMIIPKERHGEELDILKRIRAGKRIDHFETVRVRKSGDIIDISATISPIKDNSGKVIGISKIARDITDRKMMEKMKVEFISTVSHELRTPLTSIKGSLGLIKSGVVGELPGKVSSMIDIAYNNSDRLSQIINDLLDIEKAAVGGMEVDMNTIQLMPLLEQSITANKGYGERYGVDFVLSGTLDQAIVKGDHNRLMQVMANLMSNAAKFSPKGGRVKISLSQKDDSFRVAVIDNGPGIPDEFHDKIFQRFAQADSSDACRRGGTGLGLSIARAIIEMHGGNIDFNSERGKGTTFYFDLPIIVDSERTAEGAGELNGDATGITGGLEKPGHGERLPVTTGHRILHVEDDPDIIHVIKAVVGELAIVTAVDTLAKARQLLADRDFDLVILNLSLSDDDGESLLPFINGPGKEAVPVIAFSDDDVSDSIAEGVKTVPVGSTTTDNDFLENIRAAIGAGECRKGV